MLSLHIGQTSGQRKSFFIGISLPQKLAHLAGKKAGQSSYHETYCPTVKAAGCRNRKHTVQ
jgi:hypothetical protein